MRVELLQVYCDTDSFNFTKRDSLLKVRELPEKKCYKFWDRLSFLRFLFLWSEY